MYKLLTFAMAIAFASAAAASQPLQGSKSGQDWYWWLHPKLGMVKVDRATNAMVIKDTQHLDKKGT